MDRFQKSLTSASTLARATVESSSGGIGAAARCAVSAAIGSGADVGAAERAPPKRPGYAFEHARLAGAVLATERHEPDIWQVDGRVLVAQEVGQEEPVNDHWLTRFALRAKSRALMNAAAGLFSNAAV